MSVGVLIHKIGKGELAWKKYIDFIAKHMRNLEIKIQILIQEKRRLNIKLVRIFY